MKCWKISIANNILQIFCQEVAINWTNTCHILFLNIWQPFS